MAAVAAALGDLRGIQGDRKKGERQGDHRLADYVLLTRNKSSWMGRLEDRLESMSDKSVFSHELFSLTLCWMTIE